MDEIFEKVDFQVIFVVVAVIIAALQAFVENRRKRKAERDLLDDVGRPAPDRRGPAADKPPGPAGGGAFGDLYEEYRRQIAEHQRRQAGSPETYSPPWQPPAAEPAPPPLPPAIPATPKPAAKPIAAAPAAADPWQLPKVKSAAERLNPAERAALKAVKERQGNIRVDRRGRPSSARQLLRDPNGRRNAIVLREIIGPPKGQ